MARILVADDEASIRDMIARACRREGHEVYEAQDAASTLTQTTQLAPDLLVLDLNMPGGGGQAVLKELDAQKHGIPVIVVSGHVSDMGEVARDSTRVLQILEKPFSIPTLAAAIRMALVKRDS